MTNWLKNVFSCRTENNTETLNNYGTVQQADTINNYGISEDKLIELDKSEALRRDFFVLQRSITHCTESKSSKTLRLKPARRI
jgi:hypothetical protein